MKLLTVLVFLSSAFLFTVSLPALQVESIFSEAEIVFRDTRTPVPLRIEGAKDTIFEGIILAQGYNITDSSSKSYH